MRRVKLTIEYDGRPFVGWQRQDNGPSVQGALEEAAAKLFEQPTAVHGAGRTDTGVHAWGQVAHIEPAKDIPAEKIGDALNYHLKPHPVSIVKAEEAAEDFHARFSATKRHYVFRILNRRAPAAIDAGFVWQVAKPLNADAMHEAAQVLVGQHDFTTFRSVQCQAQSPVKTLDRLDVARFDDEIEVRASARSFLHNQVRSLVGTLKMVGEGKWTAHDVQKALKAADRSACGPVSPPDGLYLERVDY